MRYAFGKGKKTKDFRGKKGSKKREALTNVRRFPFQTGANGGEEQGLHSGWGEELGAILLPYPKKIGIHLPQTQRENRSWGKNNSVAHAFAEVEMDFCKEQPQKVARSTQRSPPAVGIRFGSPTRCRG